MAFFVFSRPGCYRCTKKLNNFLTSGLRQHYRYASGFHHIISSVSDRRLESAASSSFIRVMPWGINSDSRIRSVLSQVKLTPESKSYAKQKVRKYESLKDDLEEAKQLLIDCGIKEDEIERNPGLLSIPLAALEDRLLSWLECGWSSFCADMILFHDSLFFKRTVKDVIGSESESFPRGIMKCLLQELELAQSFDRELDNISPESLLALTLQDLRLNAFRQYLLTQQFSPMDCEDIFSLIMRQSGRLARPVTHLRNTVRYLIEDFQLSPTKIRRYKGLLLRDHRYFEDLIASPTVLGFNTRIISSVAPQVLFQSRDTLSRLENLFKAYGIRNAQVLQCPIVVRLKYETIEERLEELNRIPEIWKFSQQPSFLHCVSRFEDVLSRLSFLKTLNISNYTLTLLICSQRAFHQGVRKGGITQHISRAISMYDLVPVAEYLGMPVDSIKKQLRIYMKDYSIVTADFNDIPIVMQYIQQVGITRDQLLNGLSIVIYPANVVRSFFSKALADPHISARRHQGNFLHYVLFLIEKHTNFVGPCAWIRQEVGESDAVNAPSVISMEPGTGTVTEKPSEQIAKSEVSAGAGGNEEWFEEKN